MYKKYLHSQVGFSRLPAGDVVTIIFSSPALVMIFAHFLDKEHCGIFRVLVVAPIMVISY